MPRRKRPTPTRTPTAKKKARKPTAPRAGDWKAAFLEALAHSGNVSEAAKKAKVHRDSAYAARAVDDKADPQARAEATAFGRAWDSALEVATDALELEARRRALDGVDEPVGWYQGEAGGTVRRYSDVLLMFLLKAHRPDRFRESLTQRVEHSGPAGGPITTQVIREVVVELPPDAVDAEQPALPFLPPDAANDG